MKGQNLRENKCSETKAVVHYTGKKKKKTLKREIKILTNEIKEKERTLYIIYIIDI